MKKIALALAAIAFGASAFAADVSFYNKIYQEDPFFFHDDYEDENSHDWPVLKDEMSVEYQSDHVDASITAVAGFDDFDDQHFGFDGYIDDWYVEFRIIEPLTLGLHDNIYMDGSYLPVYDDNVAGGDIGSDGVTVVWRPSFLNNALRIAGTLPFDFTKDDFDSDKVNWIRRKYTTYDYYDVTFNGTTYQWPYKTHSETDYLETGVGAIYDHEFFQVGVSFQNFLNDEFVFGSYISFPNLFGAVDGLTIGGGVSHIGDADIVVTVTDDDYDIDYSGVLGFDDLTWFGGVYGETLLSSNITYEKEGNPFNFGADLLYNFGEDFTWDLYTAVNVGFGITEKLSAHIGGKLLVDTDGPADLENVYGVDLGVDFNLDDHNSFGAGFEYQFYDSNYQIAVPVYWQWTL